MNRRIARTAAAVLLALAALVPSAAAKDYYFPQVRVAIAVAADGSFTVDESRTFEFEGELVPA